jgi:hypothetical protein
MSGNIRKNQVTRLVTLRHRSTMSGALDPGVPVVQMLHIDYNPDGRTLQVADDIYAADRHEFAFEWSEPGEAT